LLARKLDEEVIRLYLDPDDVGCDQLLVGRRPSLFDQTVGRLCPEMLADGSGNQVLDLDGGYAVEL
jgi:hypothetical protein